MSLVFDEPGSATWKQGCCPGSRTPTPARQAGIAGSVVTAAQLLPLVLPNGRTSTGARQATAALRPHASASFQVSGLQYPETAHVLPGLYVRARR